MKIIFFSFQGISNGIPRGAVKGVLPIAENLGKNHNISFFLGYFDNFKSRIDIKCVSLYYRLSIKIYGYFSRLLNIPNYKQRYFSEILFDYFSSIKIKEPSIIISSAYLTRTLKKNSKLGGINIFIAYNPYDVEISSVLKKEQENSQTFFTDSYTYEKRISMISNSISFNNYIYTLTISEYDSFIKYFPSNKLKYFESHILPNPLVFPSIIIPENKKLTFCFIAHPFWLKGLPYLLKAWSKVDHLNLELKIIGNLDSLLNDIVEKKYSSLNNIKYLGWVSDLNQAMRSSDICIVPSLIDAGPTTASEAMFCGLPLIISDNCGSKTLVQDGVNGFIIPAGDSDELEEKILWFYHNQERIESMGSKANDTILNFMKTDNNHLLIEDLNKIINLNK
jgi:glycosyltransferase involved in cell wall biosynthesis